MILIDMEKLVQDVTKRRYTQASLDLIINQPVVPAIPMDYLKNLVDVYSDLGLDTIAKELDYIIDEWVRENVQE